MYPKYRIVEMIDGTYNIQWKISWLQLMWSNLSTNKTLDEAKDSLKWNLKDDQTKRQQRNNKVKKVIEYSK